MPVRLRRASPLLAVCASYAAFGMPIAMLGAGWPELRLELGRSSGALGVVAAAYGVARLSTSASALVVLRRWTIGAASSALLAVLAVACAGVAVTRSFEALVVLFVVVGVATGALDSLGTRYQTVVRRVRHAGFMFGAYGVGSTVGPALVAVTSWTVAYSASALLAATAAVIARSGAVRWPDAIESPRRVDPAPPMATAPAAAAPVPVTDPADAGPGRRRRAGRAVPVWPLVVSLTCFALYTSLEVITGNWAASYLEEHRGAGARWAGLAVSGYWAGLTLSRLAMGVVPVEPRKLLTIGGVSAAAVLASIPFLPTAGAIVAFVVVGACLAVMLPTLVVTTVDRVGTAAAGRVTGWQLLAANVGGTAGSAGVGVLVGRTGDGAPIAALIVLSLVALPVLWGALSIRPHDDGSDLPHPAPTT